MRRNILSGLILLLPITITIAVFIFLIDLLTTPFLGNMENLIQLVANIFSMNIEYHTTFLMFLSRIFILILLFMFVVVLGFLGNKIFFHWLVKTLHTIMGKIPLINSIYKVCKDIIEAVFSEKKKLFSRVVCVPFPSASSKAIGLITGNAPFQLQPANAETAPEEILKSVFIPTSPHPISGFLLLSEEKYLQQMDLSVEDAFKFLISCGIFNPDQSPQPSTEKEQSPILPSKK